MNSAVVTTRLFCCSLKLLFSVKHCLCRSLLDWKGPIQSSALSISSWTLARVRYFLNPVWVFPENCQVGILLQRSKHFESRLAESESLIASWLQFALIALLPNNLLPHPTEILHTNGPDSSRDTNLDRVEAFQLLWHQACHKHHHRHPFNLHRRVPIETGKKCWLLLQQTRCNGFRETVPKTWYHVY